MDDFMARVLLSKYASSADEKVGALVSEFGACQAIEKLIHSSSKVVSEKLRSANFAKDFSQIMRETELAQSFILTPESISWPVKLSDLDFATPYCLWVKGNISNLMTVQSSCAVVGARAATSYGERISSEIGSTLGQWGIITISGGAFGIDAAAHRGALAADGITYAVVASGIDIAYPSAHAGLLKQIAADGLLISEAPPGSLPLKQKFLTRNRLIAALSEQVVVVEAALRSGSLSTANWANAIGRKVLGVPGPITSATSAGVHVGIRNGSIELLAEIDDLIKLEF